MALPVRSINLTPFHSSVHSSYPFILFLAFIYRVVKSTEDCPVVSSYRRALWLYPLFQIPLMCLAACLIAALLFWLLGLGRPNVAVAIAIDLSGSTYNEEISNFNAPGTVMAQEVQAVQAYIQQNTQQLKQPNAIQIFGFAGKTVPLTNAFQTDGQQVSDQLTGAMRQLQRRVVSSTQQVVQILGQGTNLDRAIQSGTNAFASVQKRCRELLLVTDGMGQVSDNAIADAIDKQVKINAIVLGTNAPEIRSATQSTNGLYISGDVQNLQGFFTRIFFQHINSNLPWVWFWLGAAWISLMWTLIMPLDRWIFQGWLGFGWPLAGKLSLGNAFFWSIATLPIVWRLAGGLPFLSRC